MSDSPPAVIIPPAPESVAVAPMQSTFSKVLAVLANPTIRRLLVFLLGFGVVALNKRLGLDLNAESLVTDGLLVLGYLGQSAFTDASKARSDALVAMVPPSPR